MRGTIADYPGAEALPDILSDDRRYCNHEDEESEAETLLKLPPVLQDLLVGRHSVLPGDHQNLC